MGTYLFIQHEIIGKKMTPTFTLPEDQLLNLTQLKSKAKPLTEHLKGSSGKSFDRKDLDPKWDSVFWSEFTIYSNHVK